MQAGFVHSCISPAVDPLGRPRAGMTSGTGHLFKMDRRNAAVGRFGCTQPSGVGRLFRFAQMTALTTQRRTMVVGFCATGDHMVVAIAMAIHTVQSRLHMHIFVPCPFVLGVNRKILIGMTKIAAFVRRLTGNIKKDRIIAVKYPVLSSESPWTTAIRLDAAGIQR